MSDLSPNFGVDDDRLWYYRGIVTRVVDGDTMDVLFDLGMRKYAERRIRLVNVDTPEIHNTAETSEEYEAGMEAKQYVEDLLDVNGREVVIRTNREGSFGRWLATVYVPGDGKSINEKLVDEGLGEVEE